MKKSGIMQIIKEEVEVVLTNAEAVEMFDLDPAALLDEMMTPDAYGDTKESCAAKGLPWDEAAGKCGPWKSGLEEAEEAQIEEGPFDDIERAREGGLPPEQAEAMRQATAAMTTRAGDPQRHADWGQAVEDEDELGEEKDPGAKVRNRPDPVFDDSNPKVKDDKDHFPINTKGRARNALARASQYSSKPPWWDGTLQSLVSRVRAKVKAKYPSIETSKASAKPGKG